MNKGNERKKKVQFVEFITLSFAIHFLIIYIFMGDVLIMKSIPMMTGSPVDVYVVGPEMERQIVSIDEQIGDKEQNNKRVNEETRARSWGKPFNKKLQIVQGILKEDLDNAIGEYMRKKESKRAYPNNGDKNYSEPTDSSTYDFLPDVKEGEITSLNTAEFVYYSFYRRVEDGIVYFWNRYVNEYIISHPDVRRSLSNRDYITEIEAVLDKDGNFVRMHVIRSSGVAGIDSAPGKAFADASPFQNPPQGMLGQDDMVRMRWRFIVSVVEQVKGSMQQMDYYNSYQQGYPDPALQREIY
jgi:hypothetical protein